MAGRLQAGTPCATPRLGEPLTERELEVLGILAEGLDLDGVVRRLRIQRRTAYRHLQNVYGKLGARSRAHAVVLAYALGLVQIGKPAQPREERARSAGGRAVRGAAPVGL